MTGLMRSRRISGSSTEIRHCAPVTAIATAVAASFAMLAIGGVGFFAPIGAAIAQTPGTAGPVSLDKLFEDEDLPILTPNGTQTLKDAAQRARAQGHCPRGTFTVVVKKGDPLFQTGLAKARRDSLVQALGDQARNFVFEIDINGAKNDVLLDYGVPRDIIPPTLNVTWTPPKGTKVKARDRITAKAIARDDANRWQTGIKTIDLDVQGGAQFGFKDYPQPPQTCESPPPAQTLDGVYTVRANPPPIVRLRANAKDFAGNETEQWADFPTGDWVGKLKLDAITPFYRNHALLDVTLDYDGRGNLKGQLTGEASADAKGGIPCTFSVTSTAKLSANLVGQYTPGTNTMSLTMTVPKVVKGVAICPPGTGSSEFGHGLIDRPVLEQLLRSITTNADGSVDVTREDISEPQNTFSLRLKLHRAQN